MPIVSEPMNDDPPNTGGQLRIKRRRNRETLSCTGTILSLPTGYPELSYIVLRLQSVNDVRLNAAGIVLISH